MTDSAMNDTTPDLLGPDEPPAVEIVRGNGSSSAVLVCDHASNRIPARLGDLGLAAARLNDHIGWDPGAAEVARRLSDQLDAPLVLSGYSRLVIDCNRPLSHSDSIAEQSAGVLVPGNLGLPPEQRRLRAQALFQTYHDAIARLLDARAGRPSVLLSIHSFTPVLNGPPRPWHIGVSSGRDRRLAELMLGVLRRNEGLIVGDNEPYPIEEGIDYTIPLHGGDRGIPSVMIEIRQDGVRTTADAERWAATLAELYRQIESEIGGLRGGSPDGDFVE
jgi:predicted N-formylglutamate amidohydrolase